MSSQFTPEDVRLVWNLGKKLISNYAKDAISRAKIVFDPEIQTTKDVVNKCNDVIKNGVIFEFTVRPAEPKQPNIQKTTVK